ncbi:uncharacterized protein LOC123525828 [Mercenaria mercenaria]|uniref:uncharacterized protein LOC123525828 n=1 Tax=Mercenaria mercenaria TaxID=6596 RepID=UPI00234ED9EA|nr:uncharacterized protein LOC123525828 [Mercenaria mercenaria]
MEGSGQHACPTECVDLDRLSGSSTSVRDQNIEKMESGSADKEVPKCTVLFTSPTYTSNADDSGFVEVCPPPEIDDDVWPMRRENFLQSPNITSDVCSTPNRGTLPDPSYARFDVINNSPIQITHFQVSPLALRSYFIAQSDNQNLSIDQPKIVFNTVFDKVVSDQNTKNGSQDCQSKRMPDDNAELVPVKEIPKERKRASEFTRGHSTIASLLNSRPLNLVKTEKEHSGTERKSESFSSSYFCSDNNVFKPAPGSIYNIGESSRMKTETATNSFNDENILTAYSDTRDSNKVIDKRSALEANIFNGHEDTLKGTYESLDNRGVDQNNNTLQLVQKYSDISDACASDTETSTETSSSEDEHPEVKEIIRTPPDRIKTRRKSKHPCRSAVKEDPRFKGVTVWLQTSFKNGHSRLDISAFYSNVKVLSPSRRSPGYQRGYFTPQYFSDQDECSPQYSQKDSQVTVKTCASCKTRRTPLWRDAEDGTPLCNACGIRYKKYRLRCSKCWHIPKKEVKTYPNCPVCGASLRFSFHKKTW